MSGIYGYLTKKKADHQILPSLKKWHLMYGPDAREEVDFGTAGLGCALLHIPVNVPMDAPVLKKDRYTAVIDALIFNRDELAQELSGADITAFSDERLLFEIFLAHGAEGLRCVNGDFAGAVYDGEKLTLFRDHLGIRPLYWYQDGQTVAFGTDIRGILAIPGLDKSLNEPYLYANLTGHLMDESEITDFQKIQAVHTGAVVCIDSDLHFEKKAYWRLREKKIRLGSVQEYTDRMRELVFDAIRRRMNVVAGQRIGAELSGGMDSTVIDVILKKLGADLLCYSWSPKLEEVSLQKNDERTIIESTCKQFHLDCQYGYADIEENEKRMEEQLRRYSFPPSVYNSFVDCSMQYFSAQKIKLLFSGWGGDEGVSHRSNPFELWYHGERLAYLKLQWSRCRGWKKPVRFAKRVYRNLVNDRNYLLKPWDCYAANRESPIKMVQDSFADRMKDSAPFIPMSFAYDPACEIEAGGNRGRTETAAITGAMHHVQCVFPFLDYRVEDYAVSIPRKLYWKKNVYRYIYRQAFREEMVPELSDYHYKDDPGRSVAMDQGFLSDESLNEKIIRLLEALDRSFWSGYLDFETIMNVLQTGTACQKDCTADALERCLQIQMLQRIK